MSNNNNNNNSQDAFVVPDVFLDPSALERAQQEKEQAAAAVVARKEELAAMKAAKKAAKKEKKKAKKIKKNQVQQASSERALEEADQLLAQVNDSPQQTLAQSPRYYVDVEDPEDKRESLQLLPDAFLPATAQPQQPPKKKTKVAPPPPTPPRLPVVVQSKLAVSLLRDLETMATNHTHQDDIFATFYEADGKPTQSLSYGAIWHQAGIISYHVRVTWKIRQGAHVAIVLDNYGLTYMAVWLGCLRAGVVPMIVAAPKPFVVVPNNNNNNNNTTRQHGGFDTNGGLSKLNSILKAASPIALILTDSVVKFWKEQDEKDLQSPTHALWPQQAKWKCVDTLPQPTKRKNATNLDDSPSSHHTTSSSSGRQRFSIFGGLGGGTNHSNHSRQPSLRQSIVQRLSIFSMGSSHHHHGGGLLGGLGGGLLGGDSFEDEDDDDDDDDDEFALETGGSTHGTPASQPRKPRGSIMSNLPRPSIRASILGQVESEPLAAGTAFDEKSLEEEDVCCLQTTAGSTGDPKIVMITFRALQESLQMTQRSLLPVFGPRARMMPGLTWIPPDHHMGLFLAMLCPFLSGNPMHYMSSVAYEQFPLQWLELLSRYKIGWTVAPDNGYRWAIRAFMRTFNSSKTIMTHLNLSALKVLLNVGESPRPDTPTKIRKCFVPYQMPRTCKIMVGYGLAEHVLALSWMPQDTVVVPSCYNFALTKRVAVATLAGLEAESFVLLVVDPKTKKEVAKGQVGEIWVSTPSLPHLPGYYKNKQLSQKVFRASIQGKTRAGTFLRTGDIGFCKDGNLYVCGRKEDVLANKQLVKYCPPDIEWFVEDAKQDVKPGCVAAFASVAGTVEIVVEVYDTTSPAMTKSVCNFLAKNIPKLIRIEVSSVVAVPEGTLPRTSISTVLRRHAKAALLKEEMEIVFDFPLRKERVAIPESQSPKPQMDSDSEDEEEVPPKVTKKAATDKGSTPTEEPADPVVEPERDNKVPTPETKPSEPAVARVPETAVSPPPSVSEEAVVEPELENKAPTPETQPSEPAVAPVPATAAPPPSSALEESSAPPPSKASPIESSAPAKPKKKVTDRWPPAANSSPEPAETSTSPSPSAKPAHAKTAIPPPQPTHKTESGIIPQPTKKKVTDRWPPAADTSTEPPPEIAPIVALSPPPPQEEVPFKDKGLSPQSTTPRSSPFPDLTSDIIASPEASNSDGAASISDPNNVESEANQVGVEGEASPRVKESEAFADEPVPPADIMDPPNTDNKAQTTAVASDEPIRLETQANVEPKLDAEPQIDESEEQNDRAPSPETPPVIADVPAEPETGPRIEEFEEHGSAETNTDASKAGDENLVDDVINTNASSEETPQSALADKEPAAEKTIVDDSEDFTRSDAAEVDEEKLSDAPTATAKVAPREIETDEDAASASTSDDSTAKPASPADRVKDILAEEDTTDSTEGEEALESDDLVMNFGEIVEDEYAASPHEVEIDDILKRHLGPSFENELSWDESGLTSTASIPLRRDIECAFPVTLPADFLDRYPTPASLKENVCEFMGMSVPTESPAIKLDKSRRLPWCFIGFLQVLLMPVLIIFFAAPLLPCWYAYPYLQDYNILVMLFVPIYLTTYSVIVITAKWLVIWRYKECRIVAPSLAYLRWWFVDRLVSTWECWVGWLILDTPLIWLFYRCMGANIHPSSQLAGFIREFDLVDVGAFASLRYPCTKCRRFFSWEKFEAGPTMLFRRIAIGECCTVYGMLSPGVTLGKGVLVKRLAVLQAGSTVPDNFMVAGNPGYIADEIGSKSFHCWLPLGAFKILWLIAELAFLFGIWQGALWVNPQSEAATAVTSFDYLYWFIFAASCILLSLLSSVTLKLVLIGNRRPGKRRSRWRYFYYPADWAADYHFYLVTLPWRIFANNSRLSNLVLMFHGMDIDFASKVEMECFPPSKMDLIHVSESSIGAVSFNVKSEGIYYRTNIVESSLSQYSYVDYDVSIMKTLVPPFTVVEDSVIKHKLKPERAMKLSCALFLKELFIFTLDVVNLVLVAFTAFPAFLVWEQLEDYASIATCVPISALAVIAKFLAWMVLILVLNSITFLGVSKNRAKPWIQDMHWVYKTAADSFEHWSFFRIFYGTPVFPFLARIMGASVEGRMLYFGERIYDLPLITIGDRTVIDNALVVGHNMDYGKNDFGRTQASGILHERTYIMSNSSTAGREESGPWHAMTKVERMREPPARRSTTLMSLLARSSFVDLEASEQLDAVKEE